MINLKIHEKISYGQKLFYKKPKYSDALRFIEYYSTGSMNNIVGFKKEKAFTKIIDITKTPEELLAQCGENTRYKIKRAEREGVRFEVEGNIEAFIDFYNSFAKSKNITQLRKAHIFCLGAALSITKAVFENEILVIHSYILDKEIKRVRLLNTASLFRYEDDSQKRNLIGRANRFLHFQDMIYFKNQGFKIYDMGGYAYNTNDGGLKKINEFKDGFGGELIEENNYLSLPLYIVRLLIILSKKLKIL